MAALVVCVKGDARDALIIRHGIHLAHERGLDWILLHIAPPNCPTKQYDEAADRLARYRDYANAHGGRMEVITHACAATAIIDYVGQALASIGQPVVCVVMGDSSRPTRLWCYQEGWRVERKLRSICDVVRVSTMQKQPVRYGFLVRLVRYLKRWRQDLLIVAGSMLTAFAISEAMRQFVPIMSMSSSFDTDFALIFMIACVVVSLSSGLAAGVLASLISVVIIDYCYISPYYATRGFTITTFLHMMMFLSSSWVVAFLGGYARSGLQAALRREHRALALLHMVKRASAAQQPREAVQMMHEELSAMLDYPIAFFLPNPYSPDKLELVYPEAVDLSEADMEALLSAWADLQSKGTGLWQRLHTQWRFEPLIYAEEPVGIMAVYIGRKVYVDAGVSGLLRAVADQAAIMIDHCQLASLMNESRIREEREKLRSMLLSSVSHDLKTPLASIIGSLSVCRSMRQSGLIGEEEARILVNTALEEAQRLDSFISNILEMTRIETGDIRINMAWCEPVEIIRRVEKRLVHRLSQHPVRVHMPDLAIEIEMDAILGEQVIQNLLDNAAKYSPAGGGIDVTIQRHGEKGGMVSICDSGSGIPDDKLEKIFDKYERLHMRDSQVAGTGLGLAICRSLMKAMGGEVYASNRPEGGACFTLLFTKARKMDGVAAKPRAAVEQG